MTNDLMKIGDMVKLELKQSAVVTSKNYSFENALKSAWLTLQETVDRNKRPALEVCTPDSIHNAILNMAVQGLNPAKKQCYFVVYGKQLQCIRSYMGAQMTAKMVNPKIADIRAQIILSNDKFSYVIENGKKVIPENGHQQNFSSHNNDEIIGAYAVAVDADEKQLYTEIMAIEDIHKSWNQSKMSVFNESGTINQNSTHAKFTAEMAKRTVINKLCKKIINTSDDSMLLEGYEKTNEDRTNVEIIKNEINEKANKKMLDFEPQPKPDRVEATDGQCRKIFELERKANRQEKILETVGAFVNRKIHGLKELSEKEATEYITIIENELAEI